MLKFQILQVKGETTFNLNNNKWKSLWLLNFQRAANLDFMTRYGSRYCLEIRNYFKQCNVNLSQEWRFPLISDRFSLSQIEG